MIDWTRRRLGVCYYPEHWPEERWAIDAARMVETGLSLVRIGEFAWSCIEPQPDRLDWAWLDRAVETLHEAGLHIVLGTPTATPPRWMVARHPDMLAVDAQGHPRRFGSRRHYDFSHLGYREEAVRITRLMAERYGRHEAVVAWQTDNEYGCHDTTLSYSPAAEAGFRVWLAARYVTIDALNAAWGNAFWSMDYGAFDEIELPNLTVTEPNPSHVLDFRRFSSTQVVAFNRAQTEVLRELSLGRTLLHNYMGRITDFDHYDVAADLDAASWDSYPLGFLEDRFGADDAWKRRFAHQGDPDFQAFHHDLYRAVSGYDRTSEVTHEAAPDDAATATSTQPANAERNKAIGTTYAAHTDGKADSEPQPAGARQKRFWVMEQQPGPVNWAPHNPAPLDGMVRLWSWEAFAHGAEVVSYFRWRQAPFAQEQMHAGLLRTDAEPAPALAEARAVADEIARLPDVERGPSPVALVFDYESDWAWQTQPQGDFAYFSLVFSAYCALRRLGLSIDIVGPDLDGLADFKLAVVPGLMHWTEGARENLAAARDTELVIGPRAGSKTRDFHIPAALPPDLGALLDAKVTRVESLRADMPITVGNHGAIKLWREHLEIGPAAEAGGTVADGHPLFARQGRLTYLAGWPDNPLWSDILGDAAARAGLATQSLPDAVRVRDAGPYRFVFNYGSEPAVMAGLAGAGEVLLGADTLPPAGVGLVRREG